MRKIMISACLIAGMLAMTGCADNTETTSSENTSDTAASAVSTEAESTETTEPTTQDPGPESYTHGEDGYYNILEDFPDIETPSQKGGTCWLYAAAMSMETAYAKENGSLISIDPIELLDYGYGQDEGFIVKEGIDPMEIGGWQWIVTESLTSGFGDLTMDGSVILDTSDRDAIKQNLHERGGVAIGVNDTDKRYKGWHGEYYTLNYTKAEFDHDITIIGYDDHFPKQYFNIPASEDGAWICYNSSFGSAGYFYVSYCAPLEYGISHSVTDKYSEVLAYDAGNEQDRYIKTGEKTTTANVFHKAGTLAAVGTYNDFDEQDIKIEIYDADFKNLLYSQDAVLDYHGYHTVELDTPVDVTDCAVSITYSKGAPVEGDDIDYGHADYITDSESGQSFVRVNDSWKDMTDSDIMSVTGADFKPNNCCIKALFS
jgi:C1A family cysteine protease